VIDTRYQLETPEAIEINVSIAGIVPRTLAYSIDLIIRWVVLAIVMTVLGFTGNAGWGIFFVIAFLFEWFYPVFFELKYAATPGKKRMGLLVIQDDLTPVRLGSSMIRNILRAADFLPFGYTFGFVSMALSGDFKRLGDLAAGTLVVYKSPALENLPLPDVKPTPLDINLTLAEQEAFVAYAERANELSESRQIELASYVKELSEELASGDPKVCQGVGLWLVGEKR